MKRTLSISIALLTLLVLGGCEEYKVQKQIEEIESQYIKSKSIPASNPCGNVREYKALLDLEIQADTEIYRQKSKQKIQFYEELCEQKREANVIRMSCENEYDELDTMLFKFYIDEEDYTDERGGEMEYLTLIWNKRKFYKHDWFSKYKFKYGWDGKWGVLNRETLEFGNLGESSTHKCKVTSKGQFKNEELIHAYHQSEKAKRFLGEKNKF